MVAIVRFWSLESSSSIAKASLSVMILKSSFLYLQLGHFLQGAPPLWPVERSFLIVS